MSLIIKAIFNTEKLHSNASKIVTSHEMCKITNNAKLFSQSEKLKVSKCMKPLPPSHVTQQYRASGRLNNWQFAMPLVKTERFSFVLHFYENLSSIFIITHCKHRVQSQQHVSTHVVNAIVTKGIQKGLTSKNISYLYTHHFRQRASAHLQTIARTLFSVLVPDCPCLSRVQTEACWKLSTNEEIMMLKVTSCP